MDTNLYLAQSSQRSQRVWSLSKKNFADFANFARGKTIRTLFYTFLHVLHGQKFNRLFVYLVYFVVNQTTTNNKTRKEKLQ